MLKYINKLDNRKLKQNNGINYTNHRINCTITPTCIAQVKPHGMFNYMIGKFEKKHHTKYMCGHYKCII